MSSIKQREERQEHLARTNPLFGPARLKLGAFCSNLCNDMSAVKGVLDLSWKNTARLAQLADEMKFEAVVPLARWRGLGRGQPKSGYP